jgi:gamma-glutamylputrescine oxidase
MADAVEGTFDRMDMFAGVPHRRIPFGSSFGGHAVALGILYYRLRDIL